MTADKIRREMAMSQRMKKTQNKWLSWCDQLKHLTSVIGNNNLKVGGEADFTISKRSGRNISIKYRRGKIIAFGESGLRMAVVYEGRVHWAWNKPESC